MPETKADDGLPPEREHKRVTMPPPGHKKYDGIEVQTLATTFSKGERPLVVMIRGKMLRIRPRGQSGQCMVELNLASLYQNAIASGQGVVIAPRKTTGNRVKRSSL
jgi:hypothetical protein